MTKVNLLESVLLGLLARQPRAGYDLRRDLERTGRVYGYVPQASQIYRQLAALVSRGLLEFEVDTGRSGPDAKVYSLTTSGTDVFLAWAEAPFVPALRPMDAHFQLHFTLAGAVSPVIASRIVDVELAYRLEQEGNWEASAFFPEVVAPLFDLAWMGEISSLGDARGNMLASVHISWLQTTSRRLHRHIRSSGAVWPDPEWWRAAGRALPIGAD